MLTAATGGRGILAAGGSPRITLAMTSRRGCFSELMTIIAGAGRLQRLLLLHPPTAFAHGAMRPVAVDSSSWVPSCRLLIMKD